MANVFSNIPVRSNADTGMVDASWWNTIRTALVAFFGAGGVDETQFTIADNQAAYTNITNLSFDHSVTRALELEYTVYRDNGTVSRREIGKLYCLYKAREGTWSYERESKGDDSLGNGTISAPLILTSAGQVQYKSDSMAGTYTGTIRYKAISTFAKET